VSEHQLKSIWTIGHSTRSLELFITMLKSFQIESVVDIRSLPGSRKYPQYNKESLEISLPENHIEYIHLKELGGRRKALPDSINTGWRHPAFKGYADYMETESFVNGIIALQEIAVAKRVSYMCSEAVWWRCHRSLISDYLKNHDWKVFHILGIGKEQEHTFTSPSVIVDGKLTYSQK
jgi:uncharacterized protein (DUF488 family)